MQREEKLQIAVKSVDFYTLSVIYSSSVNELHKPAGLQPQKGLCVYCVEAFLFLTKITRVDLIRVDLIRVVVYNNIAEGK